MYLPWHFAVSSLLLSFIDLKTHRIPRQLIYLAYLSMFPIITLRNVIPFCVCFFVAHLLFAIPSLRLGYGDVRIIPLLGLYPTFNPSTIITLLISALAILSSFRKNRKSRLIPAAPALFLMTLIARELGFVLR